MRQQINSKEVRMPLQSNKCICSVEKDFGAEDDEGVDPIAADNTLTA